MRIGKIGVAVIGLIPFNVYGECTPTPDCADMGYTETSCSGKFVRCPFDTSKLFCAPCDSKFQYTCSGDNITGGTGSACNGKYVSCECSSTDYVFSNGACICDPSCKVGAIYYSDGSCSSCVDTTKTAIGVVVKENELVAAMNVPDMTWGILDNDISSLPNISSATEAKNDYNGRANTGLIVVEHNNAGLTQENSAAIYCNSYSTTGTNSGDWYLPAAGEVYDNLYHNYNIIKSSWDKLDVVIIDRWFWSSSEQDNGKVWDISMLDGTLGNFFSKESKGSTPCFLPFSVSGDGV